MDRSSGSLSTRETGQEPPFGGNDLAEALDLELLAAMGYKQELRRHYSTLQVFAIAFSIMGLLPSIASTLSFSVPAGPAAMVWGWFTACFFIFIVGTALADLGSALPTSGGLYWWTHHFAAAKWKNPLSFLVGYSNTIGLIGGICSVDFLATVIALPIGRSRTVEGINSAAYVFGHIDNLTTWPAGWAFMLAWLSPIWSVGAFDSCIHMSEEAMNAAKAVPYGILGAIGACWSLGFVSLCIIAACMSTDPHAILESRFGQPIAQVS
ncbi:GABA-specific high-affinity permease [Microsporum audouinii]